MNRCAQWVRDQTKLPIDERASFFGPPVKKISKRKTVDQTELASPERASKQSKQTTLDAIVSRRGSISKSDYAKFEENLAMHYYMTGSAFQRVEEPHLLAALKILDPSIRCPAENDFLNLTLD